MEVPASKAAGRAHCNNNTCQDRIPRQVIFDLASQVGVTSPLTQNNEEVKVVQDLLRHPNSRITLDFYVQARSSGLTVPP